MFFFETVETNNNYLLGCVLSFESNIRLTFLFLETLVVMQHFLPKMIAFRSKWHWLHSVYCNCLILIANLNISWGIDGWSCLLVSLWLASSPDLWEMGWDEFLISPQLRIKWKVSFSTHWSFSWRLPSRKLEEDVIEMYFSYTCVRRAYFFLSRRLHLSQVKTSH